MSAVGADTIEAIHGLAVEEGLATPGRRSLLLGDRSEAARIDTHACPSEQLLADLHTMNRRWADDGTPRLVGWLDAAASLVAGRPAAQRFGAWAAALRLVRAADHTVLYGEAEPPGDPPAPYPPVLGAYDDRRLFAGREAEIDGLRAVIASAPVVCVYATSGAGKSSLLRAGLLPSLTDDHIPRALCRAPHEGSAPQALITSVLDPPPIVRTPAQFAAALRAVCQIAERRPVLVLDQFEELFEGPRAAAARARLGPYLAITMQPAPLDGREGLCRWVLAYRRAYHGDVEAWLGDVLAEARAVGASEIDALPYDLMSPERQRQWVLPIFGEPPRGARDDEAAYRAFRAAITAPLAYRCGGRRWSIADDGADRLARVFAHARAAQPDRPLVPELQVVLARMVEHAVDGRLAVPDDVEAWVGDALRAHVTRSIDRALPLGRHAVAHARSLLLMALARLVDADGRGTRRRPTEELHAVLGVEVGAEQAAEVFHRLTHGATRVLVVEATEEVGACYALGHDRLAEAIVELVGAALGPSFDPEVLALVGFVEQRVRQHQMGDPAAVALDPVRFHALANAPGILWDDDRRAWWAAWRRAVDAQRATDARDRRRRRLFRGLLAAVIVAGLLAVIGWQRLQLQAFAGALHSSDPGVTLRALGLLIENGESPTAAVERLPTGATVDLWRMTSETFVGLPPEVDAALRLALVHALVPRVEIGAGASTQIERFGRLIASVDVAAVEGADPTAAAGARARVVAAMRARFPLPTDVEAMRGPMVTLPGGVFRMGSAPTGDRRGRDRDERRRTAEVEPFSMGQTEVTAGEYRRLAPSHAPADDDALPARGLSWYAATAYAAWVGARLPSEAEWEYACRDAGRSRERYCHLDSTEELHTIGWVGQRGGPKPVATLEPCGGLYDMHGNVWEWVDGRFNGRGRVRPDGTWRTKRGGQYSSTPRYVRCAERGREPPTKRDKGTGFRLARSTRR